MGKRWIGTNVWQLEDLVKFADRAHVQLPDGRYAPARPLGWDDWRSRWRAAWMVWTGRADALIWPGGQ